MIFNKAEMGAACGDTARSIVIFWLAILSSDVPCQCIQPIVQRTYSQLAFVGFDLTLALAASIHTCKEISTVADSVQDVDGMISIQLTSSDWILTTRDQVGFGEAPGNLHDWIQRVARLIRHASVDECQQWRFLLYPFHKHAQETMMMSHPRKMQRSHINKDGSPNDQKTRLETTQPKPISHEA